MLRTIQYSRLQHYPRHRMLYFVLIAVLVAGFFTDACADSLCPPSEYNCHLNEDEPATIETDRFDRIADRRLSAVRTASWHASPHSRSLFKTDSPENTPVHPEAAARDSSHDLKSSQICPPLSSDPSPPLV